MCIQGIYKLPICGTTKIIGVGIIGNINLLLYLYYHYNKLDNIYIDMHSNGNCIVYDEEYEKMYKITNPFEYYFERKFSLNKNIKEINMPSTHNLLQYFHYGNLNLKYKKIYEFIKQKFYNDYKIKDDILIVVNDFEKKYFNNKKILGIQIRSTDMMATNHNQKKIEYFITKIKQVLYIHKIDNIFIASDNNKCIQQVISMFKKIPISYVKNIERVNSFNDVRGAHDRINTKQCIYNNRKYHNYLCGKEAIIDVLLLAKCDYLIRSYSSLSDAAIILNENIKVVYD